MTTTNSNIRGIGFLLLAITINSLQNVAVKWIGGNYSVLEIVAIRSFVALPITLLFFRGEGGGGLPTTQQPKRQLIRGLFLFLSYTTHMMGVAALTLAEVESIRFSGPLMITILSVFLLGEKVEWRRWLALLVGFAGVMLIVNPGSATFNAGSLFILISVLFYALTVIVTRTLRTTESSATMAYYIGHKLRL
ncbi:MAG: DMT family transporter [Caldilineaceae bacterium]